MSKSCICNEEIPFIEFIQNNGYDLLKQWAAFDSGTPEYLEYDITRRDDDPYWNDKIWNDDLPYEENIIQKRLDQLPGDLLCTCFFTPRMLADLFQFKIKNAHQLSNPEMQLKGKNKLYLLDLDSDIESHGFAIYVDGGSAWYIGSYGGVDGMGVVKFSVKKIQKLLRDILEYKGKQPNLAYRELFAAAKDWQRQWSDVVPKNIQHNPEFATGVSISYDIVDVSELGSHICFMVKTLLTRHKELPFVVHPNNIKVLKQMIKK